MKRTANNYEFTIVNKHLFNVQNQMKLFITLDLDTIPNSGRITLPEDSLTRVPKKAAWEYCLFIGDNEYGYYTQNGTKHASPMGMLVNKAFGDSGQIKITVSKQLLNSVPAIRFTLSTFAPGLTNNNSLIQGGSSAADVWPGTKKTFGGEINGFGQITPNSVTLSGEYTIYYVYDGIDPIVEYSPDGNILSRYIYANGKHVAEINGADTNWYHGDALGSTRIMTNELGDNVWCSKYQAFGEMVGDGGNEHTFTGKEWDTELSLNYFCQRYYDPEIGRFMEMDPILNPSVSSYAYCNNNPLIFTDPTGEKNTIGFYQTHVWSSMNFKKSEELDPDFWPQNWGWDKWDYFYDRQRKLERSNFAKTTIGKLTTWYLRYLILNGKINIEHCDSDFDPSTGVIYLDQFCLENDEWNSMEMIVHEVTHAALNNNTYFCDLAFSVWDDYIRNNGLKESNPFIQLNLYFGTRRWMSERYACLVGCMFYQNDIRFQNDENMLYWDMR